MNTEKLLMRTAKFVKIKIMKNLKIIISICILFSMNSCEKSTDAIEKESNRIITLLYNKESSSFPVPPPPKKDVSTENLEPLPKKEIKEYKSDEIIYKNIFAICVDRENNNIYGERELKIPIEYKEIFLNSKRKFTLKKNKLNLSDSNGNKIHIINKNGLKIQELNKRYKVLGILFLSEIKFNKELNKAVVVFGSYTHGLAGHTSIISLEKENKKWGISYQQLLSES